MLAAIPPPPGNVLELGPLTIHYYGIAIAVGAILAVWLIRRRWAAVGGDPDLIDRAAFWAVVAGLLGARLGYVVPRLDRFADRPLSILFVWEGGLVWFGGLLFGALAALWVARRSGAPLPAFADAVIPGIPLGQAIGRWGNYFNEELYGTPTDVPWALRLSTGETVHPTFAYEMLANLAIVALLIWIGSTKRLRQGSLVFVYLVGYGTVRFALEFIRTDVRAFEVIFTANQWVALGIFVGGLVALRWWQARGPLPGTPEDRRTGDPIAPPAEPVGEEVAADVVAAGDPGGETPGEPAAEAPDEPASPPEGERS